MITSREINRPEVVKDLSHLFQKYEEALVANDVAALQGFFWNSPRAIRFGVTEELYGADAITRFRQGRVINFSERRSVRQEVVTFGSDLGITTLEFTLNVAGQSRAGRQTQVWARVEEQGWRIVSAHISSKRHNGADIGSYRESMSQLLGLPIASEHAAEVDSALRVMSAMAAPLMELALPDDIEPAPRFRP